MCSAILRMTGLCYVSIVFREDIIGLDVRYVAHSGSALAWGPCFSYGGWHFFFFFFIPNICLLAFLLRMLCLSPPVMFAKRSTKQVNISALQFILNCVKLWYAAGAMLPPTIPSAGFIFFSFLPCPNVFCAL